MSLAPRIPHTKRRKRADNSVQRSLGAVSGEKRRVAIDPNAGENIVLHKDTKWKESWERMKENNPLFRGVFSIKRAYNETDNPVIAYARDISERVSGTFTSLFEENETARTIKEIQLNIDPYFSVDSFMKEARAYIVPEVVDAYLSGDVEMIREWCSDAAFNILTAGIKAQRDQGLISDSHILDLRNIELVAAKMLEDETPVLVLSFSTQEVIVFRDMKTGDIVYGKEDHIEQAYYACVLTKRIENIDSEITGGWCVMDMAKHGMCSFVVTVVVIERVLNCNIIGSRPTW